MNATLARLTRLAVDLSHESDACLLDGFLAGSQPAFRELVYRHGPLVFAVCQRVLRHRQDAEDAFQAVFLVLARRAADVWPRDAVGSWLHGVASRVALKARVTRSRRTARLQPLEDVPQPDEARPEPDTAEIVDRVVRKLPEVYRAAVIACDLEGLSRKDAAGQLGWSEGTLSGRLARARRLLADRLRKAGITLPVGGLAVSLGITAPVRAGLEESVMELVSGNAAVGVSAPVAALAEGVVSSMRLFKLKAVATVMLATCAIGYGAWAAGSGDGPGSSAEKQPVLALAAVQGQPKPVATPEKPKLPPALEPLQGKWRVMSIREGEHMTVLSQDRASAILRAMKMGELLHLFTSDDLGDVEIDRNTLAMPVREGSNFRKGNEFQIVVDDTRNPKTFDLSAPGKPGGKGIYMLTARAKTCAGCHKAGGYSDSTDPREMLQICRPGEKYATGLRLAIPGTGAHPVEFGGQVDPRDYWLSRFQSSTGTRPAKFGGQDTVELQLERTPDTTALDAEYQALKRELDVLQAGGDKNVDAVRRVLARMQVVMAQRDELDARIKVAETLARLEEAKAAARAAQVQFAEANGKLVDAMNRLTAAEAAAKKDAPASPAKDDEVFTVHVRPLAAAEKVIRVKATGNETVLEGLAYAAADMALKADALTVWVARGKEILPVDLAALHNGVTTTKYVLKPGDRLFVQARLAK